MNPAPWTLSVEEQHTLHANVSKGIFRLPPLAPGRFHPAGIAPGIAVEQHPVAARIDQPAIIVLAMQFHQRIGQGAQHIARNPAIIHERGLAAIGTIHTA